MSETTKELAFQQILVEYFPRDAVRVLEDVRLADVGYLKPVDADAGADLACLFRD